MTNKSNTWLIAIFKDKLEHPKDAVYDLSCRQKSRAGKMYYLQVLIYDKPIAFGELRKIYPKAQIDAQKSVLNVINNIKKDTSGKRTDVVEIGKLPLEQELNNNINKNNNNKNEKESNNAKPKEKLITVEKLKNISNPKKLYFDEYDVWLNIHSNMNCEFNTKDMKKKVEVYYIFGPSGVGKTKTAYDIIANERKGKYEKIKFNRVSYNNYCWNGVSDKCEIALYDDFVDDINPIEFKHFINHDKQLLNTQNGYMKNNYKLIIITSTQNPQDLFKDS